MAGDTINDLQEIDYSAPEAERDGLQARFGRTHSAPGGDRPEDGDGELVRDRWTD